MNRQPCCQKCTALVQQFPAGARVQRAGGGLGRFRWGQVLGVAHLPGREPQLDVLWPEMPRLEEPGSVERG